MNTNTNTPAMALVSAGIVKALSGEVVTTAIIAAVQGQEGADSKWVSASDQLYVVGIRASMLGDDGDKDIKAKVDSLIVQGYSEKAQILLSLPSLIGVSADDRAVRKLYMVKVGQHRGILRKHLKAHDDRATGVQAPAKTLAERLILDLQGMMTKIQKADESKINFDVTMVLDAIELVIAELS